MVSLTMGGFWVLTLTQLFGYFGVHVSSDAIAGFVQVVGAAVGLFLVYWGRYRQGDITWYGAKITL